MLLLEGQDGQTWSNMEGQDGQTWKDHVHNYAPCHFPNVDGQMDPSLVMVLISL